jgi:hypothetical protein
MRKLWLTMAIAAPFVLLPHLSSAKGCLKGAAVGGVVGRPRRRRLAAGIGGSEERAFTYISRCQTSENPLPILREKAQTVLNVCAPNVEKERAMTNEF